MVDLESSRKKVNNIYHFLTFIIIFILILSLFLEFINQRWTLFFVTLLALFFISLPFFFQKKLKISFPPEINLAIVFFIAASLYLGEVRNFYEKFFWWDTFLHLFSGFILGTIGFGFLYILYKNKKLIASPSLIVFLAFCFAMTMGVLWELIEFFIDTIFEANMQRRETGVIDTMYDFMANTVGALISSILGYFYLKKGDSKIYNKLVKYFEKKNPQLFK